MEVSGTTYFSEEEIRTLYKMNWVTTPGYILMVKGLIQPEGEQFHVEDVTKFCKEWEISTSAFYRAIKTLTNRGDMSAARITCSEFGISVTFEEVCDD